MSNEPPRQSPPALSARALIGASIAGALATAALAGSGLAGSLVGGAIVPIIYTVVSEFFLRASDRLARMRPQDMADLRRARPNLRATARRRNIALAGAGAMSALVAVGAVLVFGQVSGGGPAGADTAGQTADASPQASGAGLDGDSASSTLGAPDPEPTTPPAGAPTNEDTDAPPASGDTEDGAPAGGDSGTTTAPLEGGGAVPVPEESLDLREPSASTGEEPSSGQAPAPSGGGSEPASPPTGTAPTSTAPAGG